MGTLSVLLMSGVIQDGWAHAHGKVDQSFLTPWHAILYSTMALNGLVLGGIALRNRFGAGYAPLRALPYGYTTALFGVVLFALGGVADLAWHSAFGIETGIDALISPSHLLLAFSGMLVFSGPIRSIAHQYGPQTGGWKALGPMVFGLLASLTMLGFFLGYAQPVEDGFTTSTIQRDTNGTLVASLYSVAPGGALARLPIPANLDIWGVSSSPDDTHVVYRAQPPRAADGGGTPPSDLYVARADGSNAVRITHSGRHDTQAAWSPKGDAIAYVSLPAGTSGNFSLHVVRPDGTGDRTLVDGTTTVGSPSWSPDGTQIAYGSRNGIDDEIAVVAAAGGTPHWLAFTKGANRPAWGPGRIAFEGDDATIRTAALDGSGLTVVAKDHAADAAWSPDGKQIAYAYPDGGSTQIFVAAPDGSHARNASQLSGMDAAHPSWGAGGRIFFTASGRPSPEHTYVGFSLAEAAVLLQAVVIAGVMLVAVRRWRAPVGTFSVTLPLFALAMAAQTDTYYDAIPALIVGLLADCALALFGDRVRGGRGFYAFAFLLSAASFAGYLAATIVASHGAPAWPPNMLLGSPILAGIAGLLVAFCYEPPLPEAAPTA